MDGGIGESLLLDNVLTGAAVGGGISLLTGQNPLMGALTGGIGGGLKYGIGNIFDKAAAVPGGVTPEPTGLTSAGAQSYIPGVSAQAGQSYLPASAIKSYADTAGWDLSTEAGKQAMANSLQVPASSINYALANDATIPTGVGSAAASAPTVAGAATTPSATPPVDLTKQPTQDQSFLQKYKWPIIGGGLGLAALAAQPQTKMPVVGGPNVPQFGLASNYQAVPNPTPVYPRFAEGGIASLADGGSMMSQPSNVDFMGGDMFPMSQQQGSFYASPTQMPTSAQQAMASYEPKTNPLTGQPTASMAEGGIVTPSDMLQILSTKVGAMTNKPSDYFYNLTASKYGFSPNTSTIATTAPTYQATSVDPNTWNTQGYARDTQTANMASGGIANLGGYSDGGQLLKGPGDGMSDNIPASIGAKQPARLADGEFVVPADVVSHLGNGSTDAGAKQLYNMMNKVRKARTGRTKQGKQINPNHYMPT